MNDEAPRAVFVATNAIRARRTGKGARGVSGRLPMLPPSVKAVFRERAVEPIEQRWIDLVV